MLEFDTQIQNLGDADAVLGTPSQRPELFTFSACHGHYHMNDSLDYSLARGGIDSAGVYDSVSSTFFLANKLSNGAADINVGFGAAGSNAIPIAGDWNADGKSTIGLYIPSTGAFFLRNSNTPGPADVTFIYGPAGGSLQPVVGDWDGDGDDTVGLYDPSNGAFFLNNANTSGNASISFTFGVGGAQAIVGDWNGDDVDTIGIYLNASGSFFLRDSNSGGPADLTVGYGSPGANFRAVAGDWNSDGIDGIGIYNTTNGTFLLKDFAGGGIADHVFALGAGGGAMLSLSGDWDYDLGQQIPNTGYKQAFCWLDSQRIQGSNPPHYNCGNQGITAGWADLYGRGLDCQWIDITGLPGGNYQFRVSVNDSHTIVTESNYDNNTAVLKIHINPPGTREIVPEVVVTQPRASSRFRIGEPMTIKWKVSKGQNVTNQELWLVYARKDDPNDPENNHQAEAKLIVENLGPDVRSYRWTPTADFAIDRGRIIVRTQDTKNLVGTDTGHKGSIRIGSK
jgi:hypothetical protein